MALFRSNCSEKGPYHDELLDEIRAGRLDVLHGAGSYGARFNQSLAPRREMIAEALDYLAKHAHVPKIWSNHGDDQNIHNIGGALPQYYHKGDEINSSCYILDILINNGFEYFWIDRHLVRSARTPVRLVAPERTRSGHTINVFSRFMGEMGWAPNGQNLNLQLNEQNLRAWIDNRQNVIIYQHWGCHHDENRWAYSPEGEPLTEESQAALRWLAEQQEAGAVEVVRLKDLLDTEAAKPVVEEADRIARVIVRDDKNDDHHHRYQIEHHTLGYFASRIAYLDPRGMRALDAGCGIGQWSLFLTDRFHTVEGFDSDGGAISFAKSIASSTRIPVEYSIKDIFSTGYPDEHFDFIVCYGVIFLVNALAALGELNRVTSHGGQLFLSVNSDDWYRYLVDERFANDPDEKRQSFVDPIWNAYVARCGGQERVEKLTRLRHGEFKGASMQDVDGHADFLKSFVSATADEKVGELIDGYGKYIRQGLVERLDALSIPREQPLPTAKRWMFWKHRPSVAEADIDEIPDSPLQALPLYNRPYLPGEFEAVAAAAGFQGFRWAPDASLSLSGSPPSDPPRILNKYAWECLLQKI